MANSNKGTGLIVAVVVTFAVAGIGGYMLGSRAGQSSAKLETAAVATVNNEKITKNELYDRLVRDNGATAINDLIQEKLVDQEAKKANITVNTADVDAEIAKIKERVGGEEAFQQALTSNNITVEELRQYQVFRLKVTKLLSKTIVMDDTALRKYFEENIGTFDKREVSARHILVATEEEAKAIKAELDKGTDFATLAKAKSTEPAAKESGGDLGTFARGQMVPEFDKVVFTMTKNQISQPFQTSFGWHVAQVLDIKGTAPTYDAVKKQVETAYMDAQVGEKAPAYLTELQDKAKIDNTLAPKS